LQLDCYTLNFSDSHLYQHAVLPTLFPTGVKLLLKHRLFTRDSLQFLCISFCQLIPRFMQLTPFTVQGLHKEKTHIISAINPLNSNYLKTYTPNYKLP